jgi:hypothetical protein
MKTIKTAIFLLVCLKSSLVFGQKDTDKSNLSFNFSPSFGATFANYNNLNTVLRNNGIKSFGNYHSGIGVRLGVDYKNLSLFANIFRSFGIEESGNNFVNYTDIVTTDIGLEYKMNLTKKHNVQLSVYGAVGQLFSNVELSKQVNTTNFNNTISQTGNLLVIDNISNYLSGGLGLYYIGNDFVKYNIKVGYRLNESQPWLLSTLENEIPSSPRDNLSGVVLGFGVNFNFSIFSNSNKE